MDTPHDLATGTLDPRIHHIRGVKVMLDADLAELYGVTTGALMQAVHRNAERFPPDFMFPLSEREVSILLSQTVISSGHGGRRNTPHAFTEQGVAMLSGILRSSRAVRVNIEIMRAFVRMRQMIALVSDLALRLGEMEERYDEQFRGVFQAIRELMTPPDPAPRRPIGFRPEGTTRDQSP